MSDELIRATIAGNPALKACGQRYPDIEKLGNADGAPIANPTPQGTIKQSVTLALVLSKATQAELDKFYENTLNKAILDDVKAAIDSGNPTYQAAMLGVATRKQLISLETAGKMQALIAGTDPVLTIPDPNYSATIPGPSIFAAAGLPRLTAADIQGVDNRLGLGGVW